MKQYKPLVSIITITFNLLKNNRIDTFKQCLESVHNQSYDNIEHLVIDGGSIDGTKYLLTEYQQKGWINFISEPDKGIYDAMNKGILLSKGKYLAFLNSDDFYHNHDGIKKAMAFFGENSDCAMIFSDVNAISGEGGELMGVWEGNLNLLPFGTHFCHQGTIVERDALKRNGNFDASFKISADSELFIKMFARNEKMLHFEENFASYRSGGLSGVNPMINREEHSTSFYNHVGKKVGLSKNDLYLLWNFSLFNELLPKDILPFYAKLKKPEWQREFAAKLIAFLSVNEGLFKNGDNSVNNFTAKETALINFTRKLKHYFMPENGYSYKIFKSLKQILKKI